MPVALRTYTLIPTQLRDEWRKQAWLLKNSVFAPNRQNWGDGKCPGALRKSLVGLPNAILFFTDFGRTSFSNPQAFTLIEKLAGTGVNECNCDISPTILLR